MLGTARQVLDQLAGASLEGRLVERFIERLAELPDDERDAMNEALASANDARIETSFPLDTSQREAMAAALREAFETLPSMHFETTERFACGIELIAGGRRLSWTLDHALGEMDAALGEALNSTTPAPRGSELARDVGMIASKLAPTTVAEGHRE